MKLTKSKLKQLIKEEIYVIMGAIDHEENFVKKLEEGHGGEGSMARKQLARTAELATMIQDSITDETNLEEWVESKITKAQDYLTAVLNYMRGDELVDDDKDDEEYTMLGAPTEDPMGRGPNTSALRRKVMMREEELSKAEKNKKEEVVTGMKENEEDFKARYGKNWKSVMYATATNIAKKTA